jgi:predicted transcriptional regulator
MRKAKGPLTLVGRQIRARRKQLSMNRAAFACAANVSESSVARLERGDDVRASTYLAVIAYLQRRQSLNGIADRIVLLSDPARERVLELIQCFENQS